MALILSTPIVSEDMMRIPLLPATDSGIKWPPILEQSERVFSERSDASF